MNGRPGRRSALLALGATLWSAALAGCGAPGQSSPTLGTLEHSVRLRVTSPVFDNMTPIPRRYTCSGDRVSPPLDWSGTPPTAKTLVLTVVDPDAPHGIYVHWLVFNMPATMTALAEDVIPAETGPSGSIQGTNSGGGTGYTPPCPPSGLHHYQFTVYALDTTLHLGSTATLDEVLGALKGHIKGSGQLAGTVAAS